jgi:hypothetical protein
MKILKEYPQDRLESEIFTLNNIVKSSQPLLAKTGSRTKASALQVATQPSNQQIVLNEAQFNLIRKLYPRAY